MADWYVSPAGVIGNTGAIGSPWDLVSAAAGHSGAINPGDTVWLRGGTYNFTDTSLLFTRSGAIGSGVDNPDSKIIYRGYRSTLNDVSTLERAIIQETNTALANPAGAVTANATGNNNPTISVTKITNNQTLQVGYQLTVASGPAAGVYIVKTLVTLVAGTPTSVTISPNTRGAVAGGEVVTITREPTGTDLAFFINAGVGTNFVWLMDLELAAVMPMRTFEAGGPTAWSTYSPGNVPTDGLKIIDCVIHDFSGGTFTERVSGRQEIYGNIFYNQGYATGDGGGHHIYIHHNSTNSKRLTVEGNVMFQDEGVAMQMYDTAGAAGAEQNVDFWNNVCFLNGALNNLPSLGSHDAQMFIIGGPQEISSIDCNSNYGYAGAGNGDNFFMIGQPGQLIGATIRVRNNYCYNSGSGYGAIYVPATMDVPNGTLEVRGNTLVVSASDATHNGRLINLAQNGGAGYIWGQGGLDPNKFFRPLGVGGQDCGDENPGTNPFAFKDGVGACRTLAQFATDCSFFADTLTKALPTTTLVVTIPLNRYDNTGRGLILYYNYQGLANIPFNPGAFGINIGDTYMVHDVRNVWAGVGGQPGTPVLGPSVWGGGTVNLPNTQVATPVMSGSQWGVDRETTPPATAPVFNAFLFRRTTVGSGSVVGAQKGIWGWGWH